MLLVYTIFGVKVNKKIFTHLETVSIYIYAARVFVYTLTIHLYALYIVYLKPIYTRERIYSFSYSYSYRTSRGHKEDNVLTLQLYIDLLFTTIPILVYKNLRKVL